MKKYYNILICIVWTTLSLACTDKKEEVRPVVVPEAKGTFRDSRDGFNYHWVRYAGLDWTVENARYNTGVAANCTIYQSDGWNSEQPLSTEHVALYGYLYTLAGAKLAVPQGWRLPTDADWKSLELALGISAEQADAREWRGDHAAALMKHTNSDTGLDMRMGGYYTPNTIMATIGYRFMGSYAFFWTDTKDETKAGDYVFYRKLFYSADQVYRESMETNKAMLSVRFVRDAVQ